MPPETELLFAKRMIAVKAEPGNEVPNMLILPKSEKESEQEFDDRMAFCKKGTCLLVFPRGQHESSMQFKVHILPSTPEGPRCRTS
jgi:hypothetical protein